MKYANSKLQTLTTLLLTLFALAVVGCQSEKVNNLAGLDDQTVSEAPLMTSLNKKGNIPDDVNNDLGIKYPLVGSRTYSVRNNGEYNGGSITLENGIKFTLSPGALTPPADIPLGDDVTITVRCKKPNTVLNELIIEFDPHGCQFAPQAVLVLDWTDLDIEVANLYYIDNKGKYILQNPEQIDIRNKRMTLYLDHFSRYALSKA